jgi:phosphoribosylformylglycinamidine synthase
VTNCLNFGNPEKPAGYYQLSRAVAGMGEACRGLGVPVVSGNVSLYNETPEAAVLPTPTVGAIGVLEDVTRHATMAWREGDQVLVLGAGVPQLGGSEFLAHRHGLMVGAPPPLDLAAERTTQELVRQLVADGVLRTAHDCGLGGLAVALAEMALVSGSGMRLTGHVPVGASGRTDEAWFGEAATRVIVAVPEDDLPTLRGRCHAAGVPHLALGRAGGDGLELAGSRLALDAMREAWETVLGPVDGA